MMLGAIALPFLMLAVGLVAIYFGVEYAVPGWNVHSVPPPRLY